MAHDLLQAMTAAQLVKKPFAFASHEGFHCVRKVSVRILSCTSYNQFKSSVSISVTSVSYSAIVYVPEFLSFLHDFQPDLRKHFLQSS
jgi:hypothetical protein